MTGHVSASIREGPDDLVDDLRVQAPELSVHLQEGVVPRRLATDEGCATGPRGKMARAAEDQFHDK
jgi:hypothetical protein